MCMFVCMHTRKLKNKPSGAGPSLSMRNSLVFCSMFLNLSLFAFCCLFVCLFHSKAGLMGLGDKYFTRDWLSSHHVRGIFHEPCLLLLFMLAAIAWPGLCLSDFCVKSSTIQTTLCRKLDTRQEHTQAPLPPDSICINCFHSCNTDTLQTPDLLFSYVLHQYGLRDIYFIPVLLH